MKINKTIIICVISGLMCIFIGSKILSKQKNIDLDDINVSRYINIVDKASENKVQVNWKYVCSIVSVLNNNSQSKVDDNEIFKISNMFIKENSGKYYINSLEDVVEKLNLDKKKTSLIYKYIDDLEHYSLIPYKTSPNSSYMKFINDIKEVAIDNYKKYNILPSITIAQAILESNWGKSRLSSDFNNYFGIKADASWKGESVSLETNEFYDDTINDKFRKYENKYDSIRDHGKFLHENKRYKNNGVFDAKTYIAQAIALQNAGYSTIEDSSGKQVYAQYLINLIKQYNLQLIDSEVAISKNK